MSARKGIILVAVTFLCAGVSFAQGEREEVEESYRAFGVAMGPGGAGVLDIHISRFSSYGPFPASYQFGLGVFAVHPEAGPSWKIRSAIVLLLPRRK